MGTESSGGAPKPLNRLTKIDNFGLGPSKKAVIEGAQATRPYAEQPEGMRKVMSEELWKSLTPVQRGSLANIYNTMEKNGLWQHVAAVNGVKDLPEPDAHIAGIPGSFSVDGNSGGFNFTTHDADTLYQGLFSAGFGQDVGIEGAAHPGQASMRESSSGQHTRDMAAPDGLHIAIGPGNHFDAHVDKVSPTNAAQAGHTDMDLHRGWVHHTTELYPEAVRGGVHDMAKAAAEKIGLDSHGVDLPGVNFGPTLQESKVPMPEDRNNPEAPVMVNVTLRGPR